MKRRVLAVSGGSTLRVEEAIRSFAPDLILEDQTEAGYKAFKLAAEMKIGSESYDTAEPMISRLYLLDNRIPLVMLFPSVSDSNDISDAFVLARDKCLPLEVHYENGRVYS